MRQAARVTHAALLFFCLQREARGERVCRRHACFYKDF